MLAPPTWYDATPLLASLRPSMHEPFKRAIAPLSPSQLPLYDMALDLDLGSAHFDLKQMVWWTNTDAEAMPDLAFRVYANPAGEQLRDAMFEFVVAHEVAHQQQPHAQ